MLEAFIFSENVTLIKVLITAFVEPFDGVVEVTLGMIKSRRGALLLQLQEANSNTHNIVTADFIDFNEIWYMVTSLVSKCVDGWSGL